MFWIKKLLCRIGLHEWTQWHVHNHHARADDLRGPSFRIRFCAECPTHEVEWRHRPGKDTAFWSKNRRPRGTNTYTGR